MHGGSITLASGTKLTLDADYSITATPSGTNQAIDAFTYLTKDSTGNTALVVDSIVTTAPQTVALADTGTVNENATLTVPAFPAFCMISLSRSASRRETESVGPPAG